MKLSASVVLFLFVLSFHIAAAPPDPKSPPVKVSSFQAGNCEITTRFLDVGATNYELRVRNIVKKSIPFITELFGGIPKNPNGCKDPSIVIDLDTASLHGEADPGWEEMGLKDGLWFGFISLENGLAHELFHLWNSETFRYAHRRDQWFSEGCTEYYAIKLAIKAGLIDKYDGVTRMVAPWRSR